MPTVGLDCSIVLDGTGYWIDPASYQMARARVRRSDLTRQVAQGGFGAGMRYSDRGPSKREWTFTVLAYQAMRDYTGIFVPLTGQQYRDALHASYEKVATTLSFTDPAGATFNVHFDLLTERIDDTRAQADGELQYLLDVTLLEA